MIMPRIVEGDLLGQDVEVIVNAWNRNIIPWWLLLPQGVSGAIKRRGGFKPFLELGRMGALPLGSAVKTTAGRLPFKAIIHVVGISMLWRASKQSIQDNVISAMSLVNADQFKSIAFPIIGAGSGSFNEEAALNLMIETLASLESEAKVSILRFKPNNYKK